MRKNNGKLLLALIGVVLALIISVFGGKGLINDSYYDSELSDGYKVVYTVDSTDAAVVKQTADVIARRFKLLGAASAETTVEGSEITAIVTGFESLDTISPLMLKTGELSFRNSDDELVMDASVLDADAPLTVTTNENSTYIQIKVKDTETFAAKTKEIALTTSKMMVLWVDFVEGTSSYSAESTKNIPAYLGAATVTSGINSDCYITTHHSVDSAKEMVAIVCSGKLPASVSEKSAEAVSARYGKNAAKNAYLGIVVSLAILLVDLVRRYGVAGCATGLLAFAYSGVYFKSAQLLGVVFNKGLISAFAVSLAIGILMATVSLSKARLEMLKGRNAVSAYEDAFKASVKSDWEASVAQIVIGLVVTLLYRKSLLSFAAGITAGGICNAIFFALWNRMMIRDINESNYFGIKAYMIKESELPDVKKGENYVPTNEKKFNYSAILTNKAGLAVALVLACGGAILLVVNSAAGLKVLVVGCIALVLSLLYAAWQYPKYVKSFMAGCVSLLASGAIAYLYLMKMTDANAGQALVGMACGVASGFIYFNELRSNYRSIAREKINDEKISNVINDSCQALGYPLLMGLGLTLIIAVLSRTNSYASTLLFVVSVFAELTVFTYFWIASVKLGNKGNKAKKTNKKELRENTIFGINEQR